MMACEDPEDLCLDMIDTDSVLGVLFEVVLFLYTFVGIAVVADEHLCPGFETLIHRWKIPEDVAGASFMALGSAAPEVVVAAVSTVKGILSPTDSSQSFATTLGVSSILGSGMMAFTLIPGLCAMAVPMPMQLKRRPFLRDVIFYLVSLALLFSVLQRGEVLVLDAFIMVALYAFYLVVIVMAPKVRECYRVHVDGCAPRNTRLEKALNDSGDGEAGEGGEYKEEVDDDDEPTPIRTALFAPFKPMCTFIAWTCPACEIGSPTEGRYLTCLASSFAWLFLFSTILSATVTRWATNHPHPRPRPRPSPSSPPPPSPSQGGARCSKRPPRSWALLSSPSALRFPTQYRRLPSRATATAPWRSQVQLAPRCTCMGSTCMGCACMGSTCMGYTYACGAHACGAHACGAHARDAHIWEGTFMRCTCRGVHMRGGHVHGFEPCRTPPLPHTALAAHHPCRTPPLPVPLTAPSCSFCSCSFCPCSFCPCSFCSCSFCPCSFWPCSFRW